MTVAAIGWTVVHSLWQWSIVGGVAALIMGLLRHARPHTRYVIGCAALGTMLLVSLVTLWMTMLTIEPAIRHRVLYAFNGVLIMPEVFARGATILWVVGLLWLIGMAVGLLRLALEWRRVRRLRSGPLFELDGRVTDALAELHRDLRIRRRVSVHHSPHAAVPMVLGWRRPQILLPADSGRRLTDQQRRAILAHELGHVRRGDFVANVVQVIADILAFYHPAARWVSRAVRAEREFACDDLAVAVTHDAHAYARALALLEDARSDCRLVVAAASGTLLDRVQRILGQRRVLFSPARGVLVCTVALLVAAAIFAITINVPPPWLPAGIRLRQPARGAAVPQFRGTAQPRSSMSVSP